jgi:hypothetical protein
MFTLNTNTIIFFVDKLYSMVVCFIIKTEIESQLSFSENLKHNFQATLKQNHILESSTQNEIK